MIGELKIYNTLTRQKEVFEPIDKSCVGLYVCGPTVYSDVHLGNCRTFLFFDVLYRYLKFRYGKVRYVRNITDVGHLEDEERSEGEDKIAKKARLQQLEPMEIVQQYTNGFHDVMRQFNALPPSIEPTATGHIVEQIKMIEEIIANGFGYESNGSVYFDVQKYHDTFKNDANLPAYGKLSGKVLEDLKAGSRELDGQSEKRNSADFALWKAAQPEHIMRWNSPWSVGFPGWHLECSVMSTKYLGETFDIHGGGMDLKFPHHESEIAQSVACCGKSPVRYWLHTNMLTVNGTKMSKSLGNSFLPHELFAGDHELLDKGYSPMTVRFFFLSAHYSSEVDFSNKALQQAEKGYKKLTNAMDYLAKLEHNGSQKAKNAEEDAALLELCNRCYEHINDDFNTALVIADLHEMASKINAFFNKQLDINSVSKATFDWFAKTFNDFIIDILGLKNEVVEDNNNNLADGLMDLILEVRSEARNKKDWGTSDLIRNQLKALNIVVKDGKDGTTWSVD